MNVTPINELNITVIQTDILWENTRANLKRYNELVAHAGKTDVFVLPEMYTTGFSMNPQKIKESMHGPAVMWMKHLAGERNASVVGSLIIEENHKTFNRAVWVFPDGSCVSYDKRHLFSMGEEHVHFSPGTQRLTVDFSGWRFCPLICYDLRFPVWSRNTDNYDILIYMANWPSSRHMVWKNLLVSRAIENQSYCIGVNRIGADGNGINYSGDSALVTPGGEAEFLGEQELVKTFTLNYPTLHHFRSVFPVLNDMDDFQIK